MNESGISPLAKRLAEENNVNWQILKGSGDSGKVVERDVLEYLARVMAGEEDLNPTAEPLPDGLEAWPEEDVVAFSQEQGAEKVSEPSSDSSELIDDGLVFEDDFGATNGDTIQAQATQPSVGEEASIDEDIFLFDDDDLLVDTDEVNMSVTQENTLDDDLFRTLADEEGSLDFSVESEAADITASNVISTEDQQITDSTEDLFNEIDDVDQLNVNDKATSSFEKVLEATDQDIDITQDAPQAVVMPTPPPISEIPELLQGKVLRRHVQIGALLDVQQSLANELSLSELDLTTFLVKASAKALETHSLGTGNDLALMNFAKEKISLHFVNDPLNKDFRTLVSILDKAKQNEDEVNSASLLVADLSDHKLDEVMLSKDVPVLSLGLISSEGNSHQSTLSLSGNVLPDQGTAFLERVAELLSEPVRLII